MKRFFLVGAILSCVVSSSFFVFAEHKPNIQPDDMAVQTSVSIGQSYVMPTFVGTAKYLTAEEFLQAEWEICERATDGCNTISIVNWKLWASTQIACMNDIDGPSRSCLKYKNQEVPAPQVPNQVVAKFMKKFTAKLQLIPDFEKQMNIVKKAISLVERKIDGINKKYENLGMWPKQAEDALNLLNDVLDHLKKLLETYYPVGESDFVPWSAGQ